MSKIKSQITDCQIMQRKNESEDYLFFVYSESVYANLNKFAIIPLEAFKDGELKEIAKRDF